MFRWLASVLFLAAIGLGIFLVLTAPKIIEASTLPAHSPDVKNGEYMFHAGGCSSCHAAPASSKCDDPKIGDGTKLAGGRCLITPFGTFYVPNISPDRGGIGGWTNLQFVNAMMRGVSPGGEHYYPAFPYTSYQRMRLEDVLDLKAYLDTLPAVQSQVPDHDLALPFRMRRGLGLWKMLFLDGKQFMPDPKQSAEVNRGAYLVEGPSHCGECHTPRNLIGGKIESAKLSGGPAAEGEGWTPNITPHENGIGRWSAAEIVEALTTGFTPDFDSLGGPMAKVVENMAKLTAEDRMAIAAYLKSVPPLPGGRTKGKN